MQPLSAIYIGHFFEALQAIHKQTDLSLVIGEKGKTSEIIFDYCKKNMLPLALVGNSQELGEVLTAAKAKEKILFSAGCGILFPQKIIELCSCIVNFHPGDIFTCRGRHPLPFAILKKLPLMAFTAHLIDSEKIDAGPLLAQMFLPIDYNLSYKMNEQALLDVLPIFIESVIVLLSRDNTSFLHWYGRINSPYNKKLEQSILNRIINSENIGEL